MKSAEKIIDTYQLQVEALLNKNNKSLIKANQGISMSSQTLLKLRELIAEKGFESTTAEVYFFKNIKPIPMSYLIYFMELKNYELQKPKAGAQFQISFLKRKLKKINRFFYRNADFVSYMELGYTYLDQHFFSKTKHATTSFKPITNYTKFLEFDTSHCLLWAKIKAMHRLIAYIRDALKKLEEGKHPEDNPPLYNLKWTASKAAMTELVYALYSARAVNSGNADLKEIAAAFQKIFQIDLGDLYHTFGEIRARKIQLTKFINHLKLALEQRVYDADE
ncbi:VanZ family protein [Mesonia hippocampi]|uniref:VanZ family protein n=1 Tax=Mesonia hippocampi TaxID=1628250 RepID=A0A840ES95_9FLAO|nr:RteC domain-containing protein [Mesonia hippocampi]MBB4119915.1 VanZ family protein [Mesonia hippocampi]